MQLKSLTLIVSIVLIQTFVGSTHPAFGQATTDQQAKPKASIDDIAWISGHWKGDAMGGTFEESWTPPTAGTMMGMLKFVSNDNVGFYEFLTILPDGESLVLRLKHFHADLKGWEEKDKSVEFPLVSMSKNVAEFNGLTFRRINDNEMHIDVVIDQGGEKNTVKFVCHRAGATKNELAAKSILKVYELDSFNRKTTGSYS